MARRTGHFLGFICLLGGAVHASDPAAVVGAVTSPYMLTMTSEIAVKVDGRPTVSTGETILNYTIVRSGSEETLIFDSVELKRIRGGEEIMRLFQNRSRLEYRDQDTAYEYTADEFAFHYTQIFEDSYGADVCRFNIDGNGKEVSRTLVGGGGAEPILEMGMLANARFFHVMFARDRQVWRATTGLSRGEGSYVHGELRYENVGKRDDGLVKVRVTGSLSEDLYQKGRGVISSEDMVCKVDGVQFYDPNQRVWRAGDATFHILEDVQGAENPVGAATESIHFVLQLLEKPGEENDWGALPHPEP